MLNEFMVTGNAIMAPVASYLSNLRDSLNNGLIRAQRAQAMPPAQSTPPAQPMPPAEATGNKLPVWAIVLIVVGALVCACLCVIFVVPVVLGPAIGNVFSNIIKNMNP